MHDAKLTCDNRGSAEGFINEDISSSSDIQIMQRCLIVECESVSTSINEDEDHELLGTEIEETEMEGGSKRSEETRVKGSERFQKTKVEESQRFQEMKAEKSKRLEETMSGGFSGRKLINEEEGARSEKKTYNVDVFETTTGEELMKSKGRKRVFSLIDILISLSLVGPLTIGYWRGIWTWMDLHGDLFPSWFCFMTGAALHVIFAFYKDYFHDTYLSEWTKLSALKRLPYRALGILYTYIFGVACNAHWRGSWIIIDDYFFMHIWITTCLMFLLLVYLATLRCIRNLIAPPLIIFIDTPTYLFQFPTRYNVVS